jgi:hypothetical protein
VSNNTIINSVGSNTWRNCIVCWKNYLIFYESLARYNHYILSPCHHWSYFSKYSRAFTEKCSVLESGLIYYFVPSDARNYIFVQVYIHIYIYIYTYVEYRCKIRCHFLFMSSKLSFSLFISPISFLSFSLAISFLAARAYVFNCCLSSLFLVL